MNIKHFFLGEKGLPLFMQVVLLAFLVGCQNYEPKPATEQEKADAINKAHFDAGVISNQCNFIALKNLLAENIDTLMSFRNAHNVVTIVGGVRTYDTIEHEDCYTFFNGNSKYDTNAVPVFLRTKLNNTWAKVGQGVSFTICDCKEIRIIARQRKVGNGLFIDDELIWNQDKKKEQNETRYSRQKDTTLTFDCVYRLGLTENHGW